MATNLGHRSGHTSLRVGMCVQVGVMSVGTETQASFRRVDVELPLEG